MQVTDYLYPNDMIAQCEAMRKLLAKENEDIDALEKSILEFVNEEEMISRKVDGAKAHFYDYYLLLEELKQANAGDIVALNTLQSEIEANVYEDLCGDVIIPAQIEAHNNYLSEQAKADKYLNWAYNNILFIINMNLCLQFTILSNYHRNRAKVWFDLSKEYQQKMNLYDTIEYKTAGLFPGKREDIHVSIRAGLEEIGVAYQNATFNISMQSQWRPENMILPECYGKVIEAQQVEVYLNNLENSDYFVTLNENKKVTLRIVAYYLLMEGYEVEFVAGILGNIVHEGDFGKFESSAYDSKPDEKPAYLDYMDTHYNYHSDFSGKTICEVGMEQWVELHNKIEGTGAKYGFGCVQWTEIDRAEKIYNFYVEECGETGFPTLEQCASAECKMIIYELNNDFSSVYEDWKIEAASLTNSEDKAYHAGDIFVNDYEKPKGGDSAHLRANTSMKICEALLGDEL